MMMMYFEAGYKVMLDRMFGDVIELDEDLCEMYDREDTTMRKEIDRENKIAIFEYCR